MLLAVWGWPCLLCTAHDVLLKALWVRSDSRAPSPRLVLIRSWCSRLAAPGARLLHEQQQRALAALGQVLRGPPAVGILL